MKLPKNKFELAAQAEGYCKIAGVDEAGRGCLAGPVVAAACMFPEGAIVEGLEDSKKLTPLRRQTLFKQILSKAICGVGIVSHEWIDRINILQATHRAMRLAVQNLQERPDYILVDGLPVVFDEVPSKGIIKGDSLSYSIAAASIIAKVLRDEIMDAYHCTYSEYDYRKHKGYPTASHRKKLLVVGPSPIQRKTFTCSFFNVSDPLR